MPRAYCVRTLGIVNRSGQLDQGAGGGPSPATPESHERPLGRQRGMRIPGIVWDDRRNGCVEGSGNVDRVVMMSWLVPIEHNRQSVVRLVQGLPQVLHDMGRPSEPNQVRARDDKDSVSSFQSCAVGRRDRSVPVDITTDVHHDEPHASCKVTQQLTDAVSADAAGESGARRAGQHDCSRRIDIKRLELRLQQPRPQPRIVSRTDLVQDHVEVAGRVQVE